MLFSPRFSRCFVRFMSTLSLSKTSPIILDVLTKSLPQDFKIVTSNSLSLVLPDGNIEKNLNKIIKTLVNEQKKDLSDYPLQEVISWIDDVYPEIPSQANLKQILSRVESSVKLHKYLLGDCVSFADLAVLSFLEKSRQFLSGKNNEKPVFDWISSTLKDPLVSSFKFANLKALFQQSMCKYEQGGKLVELPNALYGKVIVRFPPEASGYLHIGHAKAALLNQFYRDKYNGKLILRFDDTNPTKEKAHFEEIILEDAKLLNLTPDVYSRTSDFFETIMQYAEQLMKLHLAYCDNTPMEEMRAARNKKLPSKFRDSSVNENLSIWQQMKSGQVTDYVLRAKIDHSSDNGCMRDPTLYRYVAEPHPTLGNKYCIYPTYDFACPIVDSVEGVTHALRTSEYHDRDEQYLWFLDKLSLRKPEIFEYSRFNLQYTVLSKRKLAKIVDSKIVDGWDDPRMPTVRGLLRAGLSISALKDFILAQGFSRTVVTMQADKLWSFNKKALELSAFRVAAVLSHNIYNAEILNLESEFKKEVPLVPKSDNSPSRQFLYSKCLFVEEADVKALKKDQIITLLNWGNAKVVDVATGRIKLELKPDNTNFSNTNKVCWVVNDPTEQEKPVKIEIVSYGKLLSKSLITADDDFEKYINVDSKKVVEAYGEPFLKNIKKGQVVQILRKGFYICDRAYSSDLPMVLIEIPSGIEDTMAAKSSNVSEKQKKPTKKTTDQPQKVKPTSVTVKGKNVPAEAKGSLGSKKKTKLGLSVKKAEDFPTWYSQVLLKSEMLSYYDVSGCYVIRPHAYFIWEQITAFVDGEIKKLDVGNCYFPLFVSESALKREKDHIADFAPEVAWVTKAGDTDLAEPIAIRPTSETVIYPIIADWIQSYRDLPMKLNQWCNVVRWEFKHPTPFLRTREFLWQEGHTAYAVEPDAIEEVYQILDVYARVYNDLLAIPVIKGLKTEAEKFPGSEFSATVETYIPNSGRGLQGATSHHLGQKFSKMFHISFDDPTSGAQTFVYQNSWGISTRCIGALVMIHGDDKGLVLPPKVSPVQVVIIPVGITASSTQQQKDELVVYCDKVHTQLKPLNLRIKVDDRHHLSPGWKFNDWELKGVPLRVEVGPKELANSEIVAVSRFDGSKHVISCEKASETIDAYLKQMHLDMLQKATQKMEQKTKFTTEWITFINYLNEDNIILAPFCGSKSCEESIRKLSSTQYDEPDGKGGIRTVVVMGAKSLCIPLETKHQLTEEMRCIRKDCNEKPKKITLFGKSY